MYKGLVFVGPAESGKTRKAREIAARYPEKNVTWIDGRNAKGLIRDYFKFRDCHTETELVIFDDVRISLDFFYNFISIGITVEYPGRPSFTVTPKILIIYDEQTQLVQLDKSPSTIRRFDFVDFSNADMVNVLDVFNPFKSLWPAPKAANPINPLQFYPPTWAPVFIEFCVWADEYFREKMNQRVLRCSAYSNYREQVGEMSATRWFKVLSDWCTYRKFILNPRREEPGLTYQRKGDQTRIIERACGGVAEIIYIEKL